MTFIKTGVVCAYMQGVHDLGLAWESPVNHTKGALGFVPDILNQSWVGY